MGCGVSSFQDNFEKPSKQTQNDVTLVTDVVKAVEGVVVRFTVQDSAECSSDPLCLPKPCRQSLRAGISHFLTHRQRY